MADDVWHFYRHCPRCGAPLQLQSVDGTPGLRCSTGDFTFYQNPHSAVAAVIRNDRGEVLMVRRSQEPQRGKWDFPGGFVNWGEGPEQAIRREVHEELGADFQLDRVLLSYHDWYPYQGLNVSVNALYYEGRLKGPISANHEILALTWFAVPALPTDTSFNSVEQIIHRLQQGT